MVEEKVLVTGYVNPDLDGTACAIAYAEFLTKTNQHATAALFGTPQAEAQFVIDTFSIPQPLSGEEALTATIKVVLVDASDTIGISNQIDPLQVIEIFDHRTLNEVDKFLNAKAHIVLVGSCATLVAEKFAEGKVSLSKSSAALLYSAIVSNTVNFMANVTTERDKQMAAWLLTQCTLPTHYIHAMFAAKSVFEKPLVEIFDDYFATFVFGGKRVGIAQLEILETEKFVNNRRDDIDRALTQLKSRYSLDYIFLTAINIEKGGNTFYVIDDMSRELLEKTLLVTFLGNIAKRPGVIMRKTINPLLKALLEQEII